MNPPGSTVAVEDDTLVTFLPMAAVSELTGLFDLSDERSFGNVKKGFTRFKDQDLLIAKITPSMENGKAAVVRGLASGIGCGSTEFHVIRTEEGVEPDYLRYFVTQACFRRNAKQNMQGAVGQQRVPPDFLRDSQIPFPSTAEQQRIVDKIDELFSSIDEGERALERVRTLVERYWQSVLKAAVTGELTREWREQHADELESGEALLTRILEVRRQAWEQSELVKIKAKGTRPTNDSWRRKYEEPVRPAEGKLADLPVGWAWASLDQITTKITSGSRDWKEYYGRGSGVFVMAQNIRPKAFNPLQVQLVDPPAESTDAQRSALSKGDLLVTIVGANTGDVCAFPGSDSAHYVCQSVALMRPVFLELTSFAESYLCSLEGGQAQFKEAFYGAGRPHLSFDQLKATLIPLPSLHEQTEIENRLTSIGSELADVLKGLTKAYQQGATLHQAVLKQAFSGQLVSQEPTDEPASVLLERIAAKRAATPKRTATKQARAKKTKSKAKA